MPHLFDPFVTTKRPAAGSALRWSPRSSAITAASSNANRSRGEPSSACSCPSTAARASADDAPPMPELREVTNHADRKHSGCRRRRRDPHRPQSGAVARRLRSALDRQRRDLVALGQPGRRRSRHHRRRDAGRERLRSDPAHPQGAARSADHRDERAEHLHDRDPRLRARRLRISAEAVRSEGTDRASSAARWPSRRSARAAAASPTISTRRSRWSAARRRCRKSTACSRG